MYFCLRVLLSDDVNLTSDFSTIIYRFYILFSVKLNPPVAECHSCERLLLSTKSQFNLVLYCHLAKCFSISSHVNIYPRKRTITPRALEFTYISWRVLLVAVCTAGPCRNLEDAVTLWLLCQSSGCVRPE